MDASYCSGQPGFINIINDELLRIPDYSYNSLLNTLGDFRVYPYAGLAFVDFQHNWLLQLTGKSNILWNANDPNTKNWSIPTLMGIRYQRLAGKWDSGQAELGVFNYYPHNIKKKKTLTLQEGKLSRSRAGLRVSPWPIQKGGNLTNFNRARTSSSKWIRLLINRQEGLNRNVNRNINRNINHNIIILSYPIAPTTQITRSRCCLGWKSKADRVICTTK